MSEVGLIEYIQYQNVFFVVYISSRFISMYPPNVHPVSKFCHNYQISFLSHIQID
jgi:hypothetical protein